MFIALATVSHSLVCSMHTAVWFSIATSQQRASLNLLARHSLTPLPTTLTLCRARTMLNTFANTERTLTQTFSATYTEGGSRQHSAKPQCINCHQQIRDKLSNRSRVRPYDKDGVVGHIHRTCPSISSSRAASVRGYSSSSSSYTATVVDSMEVSS